MNNFPPVSKVVFSFPLSNGRFKEVFANIGQNGFLGQNFSHFQDGRQPFVMMRMIEEGTWVLNAMILHVAFNE